MEQVARRHNVVNAVVLDLIAYDFLGRLTRKQSTDAVFPAHIMATILKERVTRKG
jgi:hypothetical protein